MKDFQPGRSECNQSRFSIFAGVAGNNALLRLTKKRRCMQRADARITFNLFMNASQLLEPYGINNKHAMLLFTSLHIALYKLC